MKEIGSEFSGILYAGLILINGEPKLIEYNVRFGDPECQALCIRLGAQILDIYFSGAKMNYLIYQLMRLMIAQ